VFPASKSKLLQVEDTDEVAVTLRMRLFDQSAMYKLPGVSSLILLQLDN
jgi:hypothetical protein